METLESVFPMTSPLRRAASMPLRSNLSMNPEQFPPNAFLAVRFGNQLILHPVVCGQATLEDTMQELLPTIHHIVEDQPLGRFPNPQIRQGGGDDQSGWFADHFALMFEFLFVVTGEKPKPHLLAKTKNVGGIGKGLLSGWPGLLLETLRQFDDECTDMLIEGVLTLRADLQD